jgi:hypothetical protein
MTSPIRSKTTTAWLLAAFLAGASSTPADAFVLCARKSNGATAPSEGAGVKVRVQNLSDTGTITATAYVVCAAP